MAERCITRRRINTLGPVAQWLEQGTHKPFKDIVTQPRTAFFHAPSRFCRDWMSLDCAPRDSRAARLLRAFSLPIPPPFISPHRRRLRTSLLPCGAFYAADRSWSRDDSNGADQCELDGQFPPPFFLFSIVASILDGIAAVVVDSVSGDEGVTCFGLK